jgi:hypothetical protein
MFVFRLNRILIHSNHRRALLKRKDVTDLEIYCFTTTSDRPLPALKGLTAAIDDAKKEEMLKKAVKQAIEARVFTPVENVKDEHVLTFGDTGVAVYEDEKIPDELHFQMILIGSRAKRRDTAKLLQGVERDPEFGSLLKTALKVAGVAANPAVACGVEIGKYLTRFLLREMAEQDDDQIGLVYQSWSRMEHYPHGERKRDGNKDLTGNIEYDYTIFGMDKPKPRKKKKPQA